VPRVGLVSAYFFPSYELALSAMLTRSWLAVSWLRRLLVVLIFALGLQPVWAGHYEGLLWWLLLPLFSPRLNAEFSHRRAAKQ